MSNKQNQSIHRGIPKKSYLELTLIPGSTIMCRLSHLTTIYTHITFKGKKKNQLDKLCKCLYTVGILMMVVEPTETCW